MARVGALAVGFAAPRAPGAPSRYHHDVASIASASSHAFQFVRSALPMHEQGRGVTMAGTRLLWLASAAVGGCTALQRRARCWRDRARVTVLCGPEADAESSEDAPDAEADATAPTRRRKRRQPAEENKRQASGPNSGLDLKDEAKKFRKTKVAECDCELILDTVLELEDVLSPNECDRLIMAANRTATTKGWGAVAHGSYRTDDVKIWNLMSPQAINIFRESVGEPLKDVVAEHFNLPRQMLEVDDAFVVRYTCEDDRAQVDLKYHLDGAIVSAILSLSDSSDYVGGGTIFNDDKSLYRTEKGGGILFAGQRLHGGVAITAGTRFILTVFFKCGELTCRKEALERDTGGGEIIAALGLLGIS